METSSVPRTSGIYLITCTVNGKIYVGSSVDMRHRLLEHTSCLRRDCHQNKHFQSAWRKHGETVFVCEVLELCESTVLLEREQYWLDTLKPYQRGIGYNIGQVAGAASRGRKASPQTRAKLSANLMGNKRSLGRKHSQETRAKMSIARTGLKHSQQTRQKLSTANTGKTQSPETIAKLSAIRKGRKPSPHTTQAAFEACSKRYIVTTPEGVEISIQGLRRFCEQHGLISVHMVAVAKGRRKSHKGWRCRLAD